MPGGAAAPHGLLGTELNNTFAQPYIQLDGGRFVK